MFLSAAMMLDWLGDRFGVDDCARAAAALTAAVEGAFADGSLVPIEAGGNAGTDLIVRRVREALA